MTKARVLHVVLSLETGGLENGIVNLVNYADSSAYIIDVLCLRAKGELADRITNPESTVYFDPNANASISSAIKQCIPLFKQYDIVHTHGFATMLPAAIAAWISKTPIIVNGEHGVLYANTRRKRFLQRQLFARMDVNFSVSNTLVKQIVEAFSIPTTNFEVVINGVEVDRFMPNPDLRNTLRTSLGLTENTFVIGSVGRMVEIKNYPCLLKAFAAFSEQSGEKADIALILIGDGEQRASLTALAESLGISGQVVFLGRQNNIQQWMNIYDVFALPSFNEGLSNTLLEAMASAVPVLATDVGGNPEIVESGFTGFLFPSDDEKLLTEYLLRLHHNKPLRLKLAQQARQHVMSKHSITAMVSQYEGVYRRLITEKRLPLLKKNHYSGI